jgi:hypothetical protein
MDAHYRQSAVEHLHAAGLRFDDAPAGQIGKYSSYMLTRAKIREGKLRIPNAPRLIAQLRAITATPMPGGGRKITSPRRAGGGHGDTVSALVCAVWVAAGSPTGKRSSAENAIGWAELALARLEKRLPEAPDDVEIEDAPGAEVELVAPATIIGGSYHARNGNLYSVNAGRILARPSDIEMLIESGFRHAT